MYNNYFFFNMIASSWLAFTFNFNLCITFSGIDVEYWKWQEYTIAVDVYTNTINRIGVRGSSS